MTQPGRTSMATLRWMAQLLRASLLLLCTLPVMAWAQSSPPTTDTASSVVSAPTQARAQVQSLYDYQENQQLMLDAHIHVQLSEEMKTALAHEIPLVFITHIALEEARQFLGIPYDRARVTIEYRTQLQYFGFNQAWVLQNQRNRKVETFSNLDAALDTLGTMSGFALTDLAKLHPDTQYQIKLKLSLDPWQLPSPMLIETLISPSWHLESEWHYITLQSPKSWL